MERGAGNMTILMEKERSWNDCGVVVGSISPILNKNNNGEGVSSDNKVTSITRI